MSRMLPVEPAHQLATRDDHTPLWLVDGLWAEQAVGLIGGEPKTCKSFLALHLAVAVASGTSCLGRFAVAQSGRVLLYSAEDPHHVVRQRLKGIGDSVGVTLENMDVQVITAPSLRLDRIEDLERLVTTVENLRPKLLVLDPFVRLHSLDENLVGDVAAVLEFLRTLQRDHQLAIAVVHHAKKGAAGMRPGQALRGSSEFHAWADTVLFMRRHSERFTLSAEHRAGPSIDAIELRLRVEGERLALVIVEQRALPQPPKSLAPAERVSRALCDSGAALSLNQLRQLCRMRKATLSQTLADMVSNGAVIKTPDGYNLAGPSQPVPDTGSL